MDNFLVLFYMVLLFAALLIPGYFLGRIKLIEEGAIVSFSNVLMYVAMPFLVFLKILETDLSQIDFYGILLSVLMPAALVFLLLLILCKRINGDSCCRTEVFCAIFPNCGFLGIPLAAAIWVERPEIVLYISLFNVVSTFLLMTVGIYILSGDRANISAKNILISPIFFAVVLGVVAAVLDIPSLCPSVFEYSKILAQLTTPLAMITLGYELSKMKFFEMWRGLGVYFVSVIKLIISPFIALVLLVAVRFFLGNYITESVILAILVATSVSTAASAPLMAKKYQANAEYAATLTLANTIICVITLPLMYLVYCVVF